MQFVDFIHDMDGQADRLGLVRQGAADGLLDPQCRIRGKFGALLGIEALDGFHQADVALVDQVEQRHPEIGVVIRDLYDQAQVGFDHLVARLLVAPLDSRSQSYLLLARQQWRPSNLPHVELDGIAAFVVSIRNHKMFFQSVH